MTPSQTSFSNILAAGNPLSTSHALTATNLNTTTLLNATLPQGASQAHTFSVTNTNDSGMGSLRQAILNANTDSAKTPTAIDTINFNLGTGAHTITLSLAALDITAKNLTIAGTGANNLTISGNNKLQDFTIETGANATILGLSITQGCGIQSGGILNNGTLTLSNDIFSNNTASMGGGLFNNGTLAISNSTFSNNTAGLGGGLFNNSTLTISNSTFSNNTANSGAAILTDTTLGGTSNISGLTLIKNTSTSGGGDINTIRQISCLPIQITVDSVLDTNDVNLTSGHISLRDAIQAVAPGGTINFASNLIGKTITLTLGELDLNNNVTIQGPGANQLTISGNNHFRDFNVGAGVNATISGLTIANGSNVNYGGGIFNAGTLTLNNDTVSGSKASMNGGGLFNTVGGIVTLAFTNFTSDSATNYGGGIFNDGTLTASGGNSFSNDTAADGSGSLYNNAVLTINRQSRIRAANGGGTINSSSGTITGS